jgi:hypothetical protein
MVLDATFNNISVILRSRWSLHYRPAIVPIEGAVLFELLNLQKIVNRNYSAILATLITAHTIIQS